jgi:spermidine/putrescine transport system ATP-binding protein
MQTELSRIHRQVGTTFVFVTHDQEEALSMATRIAIMSGGEVVQTGTPVQVYERPVNRFVANFVGETNSFPGVVRTAEGHSLFELAAGEAVEAPTGSVDGPSTLVIRPEFMGLRSVDAPAATPGIRGRIVNISFLGNYTRITVTTSAGDVVIVRPHGTSQPTDRQRGLGEEVCVWWLTDHAALIKD